eukprot:6947169-Prymnesium_polylepis.1
MRLVENRLAAQKETLGRSALTTCASRNAPATTHTSGGDEVDVRPSSGRMCRGKMPRRHRLSAC